MVHENMAGNEKKTRKCVCKMWDKHMGNPPPPTAVRMGGVMRKDAQGKLREKNQGTAWLVGFCECRQGKG